MNKAPVSPIDIFQAKVVASALRLYVQTGIKANTAYTPTKMLKVASKITGTRYKMGEYKKAISDLEKLVEQSLIQRGENETVS